MSEQSEPDLFWALRGSGGGQLGVVTSLVLQTLRAPPVATCIRLELRPHEQAAALARPGRSGHRTHPTRSPRACCSTAPSDPAPAVTANVFGAMAADSEQTAALLAELVERVGARPLSSQLVETPYREAKRWLAEHGPGEDVTRRASLLQVRVLQGAAPRAMRSSG